MSISLINLYDIHILIKDNGGYGIQIGTQLRVR